MKRGFHIAIMLGLAFSSGVYSFARSDNAFAQATVSANVGEAVSAYVVRTREIDQTAFTFKEMPDQGNLKVFRVVVTADVPWIPDIERIFDVHVDALTGQVAGEHSVRM
jgi:hypothetical protein